MNSLTKQIDPTLVQLQILATKGQKLLMEVLI